MGQRRGVAAVLALVAVGTLALPSSVGAGDGSPFPPMSVVPEAGEPGTVFTVSGSECPLPDSSEGSYVVLVTVFFEPEAQEQEVPANPDGTWSAQFTVPAGHTPGPVEIIATCLFDEEQPQGIVLGKARHRGTPNAVPAGGPPPYPSASFTVLPASATGGGGGAADPVDGAPQTTG